MIELEIQGLSESREGLLIEVGRLVIASGFTLQRQRLVQDHHGILLTMVVRGPFLKKWALAAALDACDRFISVKVARFVEGESKPHFAVSPKRVAPAIPAPAPASVAAVVSPAPDDHATVAEPVATSAMTLGAVPAWMVAMPMTRSGSFQMMVWSVGWLQRVVHL